ncbi:MAG: DUF4198 domain-containing protein [Planctomycetes bacterium]|nr:DUF4198 domain-containing protein [Planctomycetota bacterium]
MRRLMLTCVVVPVLWICSLASAHETWIVPSRFDTKVGEEVRFDITTGTEFPAPEMVVKPERIAKSGWRLGQQPGEVAEFREGDKSLIVTQAFPQPGVATVWVALKPREIDLADDKVVEYLDEIGATDELRKTWQARKGQGIWKESYAKHAKTFVAVGEPAGDESWGTPVGMQLELLPVSNPFAARTGQKFSVRILREGKPLPRWPIGLVVQGQTKRQFETSDADGKVTFTLRHAGDALLFAVHLRPQGEGSRWQSDFTTLTLKVR